MKLTSQMPCIRSEAGSVDFLDSDLWPASTVERLIFPVHVDAAAGGDEDFPVVERMVEPRQALICC
jgi:hypothetical protein